MIEFIWRIFSEALAPRTCKKCQIPFGIFEGVNDYCHTCTMDWFIIESHNVSDFLSKERFNSFWTSVGLRLRKVSTDKLIYLCK